MPDLEQEKARAAARAVEEIADGMTIGLGTGSTSAYVVRALGVRVAGGLRVSTCATSNATEDLARSLNIPVVPFEQMARIDLTIDGADEVDPWFRAIKGGGGALLREKVVAQASDRMIVVADSSKQVERLGRFPLPVEVLPFAAASVERKLNRFGVSFARRRKADGTPFVTDNGNYIVDMSFGSIADPDDIAAGLDAIAGVVEHGLFLTEVDTVILGSAGRATIRIRGRR